MMGRCRFMVELEAHILIHHEAITVMVVGTIPTPSADPRIVERLVLNTSESGTANMSEACNMVC